MAKWVNCKALGIDGVVLEFYKELWDVVGHNYWLMVSTTIRQGKIPIGFTQGLITLLSKGGRKRTSTTSVQLLCSMFPIRFLQRPFSYDYNLF